MGTYYDGTVGPSTQEIILNTPDNGQYLYLDATSPDDNMGQLVQPSEFQNLGDEMEDTTVLWLGIIDTEWNDVLDYIAIDVDHEFHASTHVYGTDNPGVNQAYRGLSSEMLANWMDDVGHPDSVHLVWNVFRIVGGFVLMMHNIMIFGMVMITLLVRVIIFSATDLDLTHWLIQML